MRSPNGLYIVYMGNNTTQTLAARVSASRATRELSYETLAERTGIPRTTLQRKLGGRTEFTVSELDALSRVLDTPVREWLAGLPLGVAA